MQALDTAQNAALWLRDRVTGTLTTDSRKVSPGDGFIAWPGAATDGRRFVDAAVNQGAVACLVERDGLGDFTFPEASARSTASYRQLKAATGPIAAAYFEDPSQAIKVIAITGTNGKTSTAWWLAHALTSLSQSPSLPCAMVGTLGIGVPKYEAPKGDSASAYRFDVIANGLTTPDPVLLQKSLRDFVTQGVKACAIEASSIGLAEHRLDGIRISLAVFTNFTQDHLDYHGSMEAYWQAKAALFEWPGLQAAVVNIDDDRGRELANRLNASVLHASLDVWTVSCNKPARLHATDITYDATGMRFSVHESGSVVDLSTRLIGLYNVANLLCVIGAMRALGVPLHECVHACTALAPVPGRMQCLGRADEPLVVIDFAHTPDALQKTLEALRPLATARGGNLWCVFGCGGNRDAAKRPLMGAVAGRLADHVVVTSDNPRGEPAQTIINQITPGLAGHQSLDIQPDRSLAILTAVVKAGNHDVVLVAGKGHEDYQEIYGQKLPFSDQAQALAALKKRPPGKKNGGTT
jgi:UDP-N-acetylmuramyl-tripeptide synthetase